MEGLLSMGLPRLVMIEIGKTQVEYVFQLRGLAGKLRDVVDILYFTTTWVVVV